MRVLITRLQAALGGAACASRTRDTGLVCISPCPGPLFGGGSSVFDEAARRVLAASVLGTVATMCTAIVCPVLFKAKAEHCSV